MRPVRTSLAAAALLVTACGTSDPTEVVPIPHEIQVTPQLVSLLLGGTQPVDVVVLDEAGQTIPAAPLAFSISDSTVATVAATGVVSAVGPGNATLTVRSAPASASVGVFVSGPASVEISPHTAFLERSQTVQLTAVARDSAGDSLGVPITFTSRAPSIVTVSSGGLVSRTGVGTTYVVATSGTTRDSAQITGVLARVAVTGFPFGAAVAPTGVAYVTQATVNTVARLDLPSFTWTGTVGVGGLPTSVAFNQTGDRAYVGNQDGHSVSVVDVTLGTAVDLVPIPGSVLAVATSGDTLLMVGTDAGKLYLVDLATLASVDSVATPGYVNALARHGLLLYASSPSASVITEIDLATPQVLRTLPVGGTPQGLVVSADGNSLFVANEAGKLQVWNLTTNTPTASVLLEGGGGFGLARNPVNGLLYVSTSYYGSRVHVIDPVTQTVVRVIVTGGVPRRIGFAPSGTVGFVTNEGGWVDFIN